MNDFFDIQEVVQRGLRTEAFRNSSEYRDSVTATATNIINAFFNLDMTDEEVLTLRKQYMSLQAIDRQLMNVIEDGAMTQEEIEEESNP